MLTEISQVVKDKYHMISSKQNITRDIEVKNKLTGTREEVGGDNGGEKGKVNQGTCMKDTWTKPKEVG